MKKAILILLAALAVTGYAQTLINGSRTIAGAVNYCTDAGASDSYACNLSPAISSYREGACYGFKANTANTGPASINLNSVGAATIKKAEGGVSTDLANNDIRPGQVVTVCYDGVNMQMQSNLGNSGGGGGGTASVTTTNAPKMAWLTTYGGGGFAVTGSANTGLCHRVFLDTQIVSSSVGFEVTTGSGTCAGTCGFGVGFYDASGTGIGFTEIGYSGHATDSKNINTLGAKALNWLSGSAVSGGVLTAPAQSGFLCFSTDSTVLQLRGNGSAYWMLGENGLMPNSHGGQASFSTGGGASLALSATKTGTWTAGWGDWTPYLWWF